MSERELRTYQSLSEAAQADREYYASLTPKQRLDLLLEIIANHRTQFGEAAERLERVYRVTQLSRS